MICKTGENLIDASDKIHAVIDEMKKDKFPKNLEIVVTGDQSTNTRITLHDLINTIIIGFILVTLVLMFFMGATNALFVAMSVPLSMFIAFFFTIAGIYFKHDSIVFIFTCISDAMWRKFKMALQTVNEIHKFHDLARAPLAFGKHSRRWQ